MSFRGEVREFMREMTKEKVTIMAQRELIDALMKQNRELMDRLMTNDFKEFKTFSLNEELPEVNFKRDTTFDFTDGELAGEIVDEKELENG